MVLVVVVVGGFFFFLLVFCAGTHLQARLIQIIGNQSTDCDNRTLHLYPFTIRVHINYSRLFTPNKLYQYGILNVLQIGSCFLRE